MWLLLGGLLTIGLMVASYRESDVEGRQQMRWPLAAIVLNLAGGAMLLFASLFLSRGGPERSSEVQRTIEYLSVFLSLAIPIAFAVAILKYRLFDLGVVVRRTAIYGLVTFVLAAAYFVLVAGVGGAIAAPFATRGQWPAVLGTLAVAALFVPARNWAQRVVDRSFFRVRYDAAASLGRLGRALASTPDPAGRARAAVAELVSSLRLRGGAVWLRSADGRTAARVAALGGGGGGAPATVPAGGVPALPWSPALETSLAGGETIALDALPGNVGEPLRAGRTELVAPLVRDGRAFGWLAAGARLSDEEFDADDRAYVRALAEQLALGLAPSADPARDRELDEARRIQAALLPQRLPTIAGIQLAAHWQPAREVAGDYYDVLAVGDERCGALCIADVVRQGHAGGAPHVEPAGHGEDVRGR